MVSHLPRGDTSPGYGLLNACLVVIRGADLGKRFELGKQSTILGRSPQADIQLEDDAISRNHAMISIESEAAFVRDMESTNGTYVNDVPVSRKRLEDGDRIKIGAMIFKFLSGSNIENAYHEEIYRLTTTDGLTQVFNKRYFLESLEKETRRSMRHHRDLALLILDLDHFKQINDNFGHLAGDSVLRQVAQNLSSIVRRDDVVARYGGEEFALICPETDKRQASVLAEKLRAAIAAERFRFDAYLIPVTISVGVAELVELVDPGEESTLAPEEVMMSFIRMADERLLEAKRSGRNRVVAE
ncbi:MAG: GGDEF domain-containing protein [Myxococcota bacterium]|nr:GGDEF domain-containing protein [Myxococcota bacterium]